MSQILAMDYGAKRTGIAVTDDMQIIASGLTTVATESLLEFLESYVKKEKVELFLIGEPRQRDNSPSDIEYEIRPFLKKLGKRFPDIPIERVDERFTSKMAFQTMCVKFVGPLFVDDFVLWTVLTKEWPFLSFPSK